MYRLHSRHRQGAWCRLSLDIDAYHRTTPMERQLARDLHCRNAKRFRPPIVHESRGSSFPVCIHSLKTVQRIDMGVVL